MPGGATIGRTAATLRQGLEGTRSPAARPDARSLLPGTTITEAKPVGKHLLIRFDTGLAIHSHMRMQGSWHLYKRGERWRRPAWQIKALLETDDVVAVCFGAPVVELVRDEPTKVGHLGPDILSDDWTAREVVARARSFGATAVGEVLLDQRVTAGIGNVYRCEALWHARINPWTKTTDLDDAQLTALFETAHEAMRANLNGGFKRRFPGYGRGAVHGRGGKPSPPSGARTRVRPQGERGRATYWSPALPPRT